MDSIEIINSSAVDALSLVQTGEADAFVSAAYSLKYYEEQGIGHMLTGYDFLTGTTSSYFVVNTSVLKENPEVRVAINKALIRSYEDITKDPDIFYNFLGDRYGVEAIKTAYGFDETLSYMTPEITISKHWMSWQPNKNKKIYYEQVKEKKDADGKYFNQTMLFQL